MTLCIKNKLILYSVSLVLASILLSQAVGSYLIYRQTRSQNFSRINNSLTSVTRQVVQILEDTEHRYTAFQEISLPMLAHSPLQLLTRALSEDDLALLEAEFFYDETVLKHLLNFGFSPAHTERPPHFHGQQHFQ